MVSCTKRRLTSGFVALLELSVAVVQCLFTPGGERDMLAEAWQNLSQVGLVKLSGYNEGNVSVCLRWDGDCHDEDQVELPRDGI